MKSRLILIDKLYYLDIHLLGYILHLIFLDTLEGALTGL